MEFFNKEYLSFDDVLLVPQNTSIKSRKDVSLETRLSKNIKIKAPIISSNMDTITESPMMIAMNRLGCVGFLHRFMSIDNIKLHAKKAHNEKVSPIVVSIGIGNHWRKNLKLLAEISKYIDAICIDVAHGDCQRVMDMISHIKENYKYWDVIAGNVATGESVFNLCSVGADAIKVGIGPGCFAEGTRVLMSNGLYKNIEDVKPNDKVINQYGKPVRVVNAWCTGKRKVMRIKNSKFYKPTVCTSDHKFLLSDYGKLSASTVKSRGYQKSIKSFEWRQIGDITSEVFSMPTNIEFDLKDSFEIVFNKRASGNKKHNIRYENDKTLEDCYELGYVLGTFLGDGTANVAEYKQSKRGCVSWYFGSNETHIADKLKKCVGKLFGYELKIKRAKNIISCAMYYKPFADFLQKFGKKENKHLPHELMCSNLNYLGGLYDGLHDSGGSVTKDKRVVFDNTSTRLIELNIVLQQILFGKMPNAMSKGLIKRTACGYAISKCLKKESLDEVGEVDVYDIEVDCPTHSFIAENAIVHNSLCTTRIVTGCGVPQLTAIIECRKAAQSFNIPIIADGGIKNSGDIIKALAAGAETVMVGNLLSGADETPGDYVAVSKRGDLIMAGGSIKKGVASICGGEQNVRKRYRGSASFSAIQGQKKHGAPEGEEMFVKLKGPVTPIIQKLLWGIRSGMTYNNAITIEQLYEHAEFIKVSMCALIENSAHGFEKT